MSIADYGGKYERESERSKNYNRRRNKRILQMAVLPGKEPGYHSKIPVLSGAIFVLCGGEEH